MSHHFVCEIMEKYGKKLSCLDTLLLNCCSPQGIKTNFLYLSEETTLDTEYMYVSPKTHFNFCNIVVLWKPITIMFVRTTLRMLMVNKCVRISKFL